MENEHSKTEQPCTDEQRWQMENEHSKTEQPCTDEQRWQMEQHLQNERWENNMSNLYTYGEDGFCDGFTNW